MRTASQERLAKEIYDGLTPGERREEFVLSPRYRSAYNRVLDSEDRITLPRYFWIKWLPILGAEAATLYVVLRDMSRVEAKGSDSWCWPEQTQLGLRVGISKNTLRKRLALLEQHGFIRKVQRRVRQGWGTVQGTNDYEVFLDIPVTPADAVELLLTEMKDAASSPEFKSCTQGEGVVDNALSSSPALRAPEFKPCTQAEKEVQAVSPPEFNPCALNVKNEINVRNVGNERGKGTLKEHPMVLAMSHDEKRRRSALAFEVGEALSRMGGRGESGQHRSLGFHRRLTYLMPEHLIREALRTTRDAVDEQKAGRKTLTGGPSAYFAGIALSLATREGIDLGIKRRSSGSTGTVGRGGHGRMDPGKVAPTTSRKPEPRSENALPSDDERARVRSLLRGLVKSLDSQRP